MNAVVSALRQPRSAVRSVWVATRRLTAARPQYAEEPIVDVVVRVGLVLVSAVTFASAVLLAAFHASDRFEVNQASGTWFALAQDLSDGIFYRPLFADGYYGLSAYMPLQFVLNAGASLVTGEFLVSAKVVAYVTALALLGLLLAILLRTGCPALISLALVATVASTQAGLVGFVGIHGDVLPVLLQVAAIALVTRMSRRAVLLAAVLCALAAMAKFTAVWAPIAIGLWLAFRARRRLALFAAAYAGSVVVMLALLEVASDGRLSENLAEVFVPGGSASEGSFSAGVATFLELVVARAGATWLLLPIAVLALLRAVARRSWTLVEIAFAAALVIVVVVLGNPGSDFNHLIDVSVLVVLVVGEQWARAARRPGPVSIVLPLIAVAVILGVAQSCRITMKAEVAHAVRVLRGVEANVYTTDPLAGVVRPEESLLTEDPTLSVIRGERPVLLDGIGLRRLGEQHPELVSDLERRLDRRAFDKVVLINSLEDRGWYETISMGARVRDAIARNYVLFSRVPAPPQRLYWVYAPRAPRKSTGT